MSAAKPARPEEAARRLALLDAPGFLEVRRAGAALWLLERIDGATWGSTSQQKRSWRNGAGPSVRMQSGRAWPRPRRRSRTRRNPPPARPLATVAWRAGAGTTTEAD